MPLENKHNAEFIRDAVTATESSTGGEYLRMYLREAVRRLEIADYIATERGELLEQQDARHRRPRGVLNAV